MKQHTRGDKTIDIKNSSLNLYGILPILLQGHSRTFEELYSQLQRQKPDIYNKDTTLKTLKQLVNDKIVDMRTVKSYAYSGSREKTNRKERIEVRFSIPKETPGADN